MSVCSSVAGVDPKSVLCAFFKQGQCTKGDKCKFSHDLSMERKCEKRSVYVDERDEELEKGLPAFPDRCLAGDDLWCWRREASFAPCTFPL